MLLKQTDNLDIYSNCHDEKGNHCKNVSDQVITVVNNFNDKTLTALLYNDKLWILSSNCHTKVSVDIPLNGERQLGFDDAGFVVHVFNSPLVYDIRLDSKSSTVKAIMEDFYKLPYPELEGYDKEELRKKLESLKVSDDDSKDLKFIRDTQIDTPKTADPIEETKENLATDTKVSSAYITPKDGNVQWETEFAFFGPNDNVITQRKHLKVNYQMSNHTLQFGYWSEDSNGDIQVDTFDVAMEKIQKYLPFDKAYLDAYYIDNKLYRIELVYNKDKKFGTAAFVNEWCTAGKVSSIDHSQFKNMNSTTYGYHKQENATRSVNGVYNDQMVFNLSNGVRVCFCD